MQDCIDGTKDITGRVKAFRIPDAPPDFLHRTLFSRHYGSDRQDLRLDGLWEPTTDWNSNLVVYEWGAIFGKMLVRPDLRFTIGMYLEFANVANPGDVAPVPTQDRTRTIEYYNNLGGADYLRVALTGSQLLSSSPNFPKGNQPLFFARSQGMQGVRNNLAFGYAHNSVIYGAALVAMASETDFTQDLVLSSYYFPTGEQQPKLATSQVGLEWELSLM